MEELLHGLVDLQTSTRRTAIKPPTYIRKTDTKLLIAQFLEISEANEWQPREVLIHLHASLVEGQPTIAEETIENTSSMNYEQNME